MIAGVKQYVDLMGANKVVNPSAAQYKNGPEAPGDFAKGKAAMLMSQNNADNTLQADGMKSERLRRRGDPAPTLAAARRSPASSPASTCRSSRTPRTRTAR